MGESNCAANLSPPLPPVRHCSRLGSRGGAVDALYGARRGPQGGGAPEVIGPAPGKNEAAGPRLCRLPCPGSPFLRCRARMPRLTTIESLAFAPCSPRLSSARRGACGRFERVRLSYAPWGRAIEKSKSLGLALCDPCAAWLCHDGRGETLQSEAILF